MEEKIERGNKYQLIVEPNAVRFHSTGFGPIPSESLALMDAKLCLSAFCKAGFYSHLS